MQIIKCNICTDNYKCHKCQLEVALLEIDILKESITAWKNAWFDLRAIIGKLWWHHPAIYSDAELQYCKENLKRLKENKNV